jgi:hypothetical protein
MTAVIRPDLVAAGCAWDALVDERGADGMRCPSPCEFDFGSLEGRAFDEAVLYAEHEYVGELCDHWPRCDERGHTRDRAFLLLRCPECRKETEFATDD